MTLGELNALPLDAFVQALGWTFEHSPWVAERAWPHRPFDTLEALHAALTAQVRVASHAEQLALLQAHPDLGARAKMSDASVGEQAGAGLDRLTPEEYVTLQERNASYRQRFGFPFLYAVKGSTKYDILQALDQRSNSPLAAEFDEALTQVYRIARFRLEDTIKP